MTPPLGLKTLDVAREARESEAIAVGDRRSPPPEVHGSPQAARALQAFVTSGLFAGHEVHVLTVDAETQAAEEVAGRATCYLGTHGYSSERHVESPHAELGTQILSWVRRTGSALLVMGAYSHSRLREVLLGSTTRTLLDAHEVPVLLEH